MKRRGLIGGNFLYLLLALTVLWGIFSMLNNGGSSNAQQEITTTELISQLEKNNVKSLNMQKDSGAISVSGEFTQAIEGKAVNTGVMTTLLGTPSNQISAFKLFVSDSSYTRETIEKLAQQNNVTVKYSQEVDGSIWMTLLINLLPLAIFGFLFFNMMSNMGGGANGRNPMSFGKLRPEDTKASPSKVKFTDVAGADEEKQELVEVVEFLKDPRKFTALGARIPAGVLLEGPPGTGKTLLAKAVAGEANVPFHSISGSEFVEMFVGVGASRVRDLFEKAKKSAPAIIFIDEIDAVGRRRGTGMGGGNDEREQTLNQLLVEMDGFEGNEGVIVIAATNRSDVLDPALLRPGRFDRQILVGNPDVKAREAILKVHARNKKMAANVKLDLIAQKTPGFSGADLENLLNESALIAARRNKKEIDMSDVDEAQDRIIAGPAKVDRVRSEKSNRIVAYHEAGHAVAGLVLDDANEVHKVTIVPRGRAAGYVISLPKEEQIVISKDELFQRVVGLLAGRAAEEIVFNAASTGASDDFRQATAIVRSMVMRFGMSEKLGPVQYESDLASQGYLYQKEYSETTAYAIDQEVKAIIEEAHQKAHEILNTHREKLNLIAEKLLEVETMDSETIKTLFETGQMPVPASEEASEYPSEKDLATAEETVEAEAQVEETAEPVAVEEAPEATEKTEASALSQEADVPESETVQEEVVADQEETSEQEEA